MPLIMPDSPQLPKQATAELRMKSKFLTTAVMVITLGAAVATTAAEAKPFGFGGPHGFHHHHGFGLGVGLVGAMALSAAASTAYYGSGCYYVNRRIYDDYGDFVGYRAVQVCD
jgi:hypothetical protein